MSDRAVISFRQASTWRGIVAVIGAIAILVRPDYIAAIVSAVLAINGSINIGKQH